ncbi:YkuS family protein [Caldisalinibacter kiritimatiensis]|uniref:YkuS family protein n=1 Tax=Caldisalinibacter kiritimatiensis TaxID=1304284 RepID=R1AWK1_9FIRM|nr:YkuS family protein [Caldisalinibacter kiritimatiensis]EOD01553.1 hypothetical protein L21TH_0356 [Caldisalinibacter kiritimatiensis]
MNNKIVVENTLNSHIDFLKNSGYDVHKLYQNKNLNNIQSNVYDAIVISSLANTPMSSNNLPNTPIIEAEGKTPEEVYDMIKTNIQ